MTYREWIRAEAAKIASDGCTHVLDINLDCCYEHDLGYYHGRDPRDAYRHSRETYEGHTLWADPWEVANEIARGEVDKRFRECNLRKDAWWADIDAWVRWIGVRVGGWLIWRSHRKERS